MRLLSFKVNELKSKPLSGFLVTILLLGALLSLTALDGVSHRLMSNRGLSTSTGSNDRSVQPMHPRTIHSQTNLNSNNYGSKNLFPEDVVTSLQTTEFSQTPGAFLSPVDFNDNSSPQNLQLTYLFSDIPPPSSLVSA